LLKVVSLHHANIIVEARAKFMVKKLRPRESDISLISFAAALGHQFLPWHAGDIADVITHARLLVGRFKRLGLLAHLISHCPQAWLCNHYRSDCDGQSAVFYRRKI